MKTTALETDKLEISEKKTTFAAGIRQEACDAEMVEW